MYTIKTATLNDVETIRSIADKTWWATYPAILQPEQISYMLDEIYAAGKIIHQLKNNLQTYLLLQEDENPAAFASYSPREQDAAVYKLHKLYCLPQIQGKGYGKILIDAVAQKTREAGRHLLELNVNRYNNARFFYEKMGFTIAYQEDVSIGKYWMNDYVMRKVL